MAYTPDPRDSTNPLDTVDANTAAAEFRAFKKYVNSILQNSIQIFKGAIADIPQYWQLCDGTNGTIDLTDKFIVGAGKTYAVGATGGEATHTLIVNELPSHNHPATVNDNGHNHGEYGGASSSAQYGGGYGLADASTGNVAGNTAVSGTGITVSTSNTGGGAAHNNLPPYYAFAFIQYTGV